MHSLTQEILKWYKSECKGEYPTLECILQWDKLRAPCEMSPQYLPDRSDLHITINQQASKKPLGQIVFFAPIILSLSVALN